MPRNLRSVVAASCLAACASASSPPLRLDDAASGKLPTPAWSEDARAAAVAIHMRDRYEDLRVMERHLVEGDLDVVREYAFSLAVDKGDPEIAQWNDRFAAMRQAAYQLATSAGLEEAWQREPRLAATCGRCHRDAGAVLALETPPLPDDDGTSLARMDRHQWAADRLWQAMITSADDAWREALDVLAATPLPTAELATVAPEAAAPRIRSYGLQLMRLAKQSRSTTTLEERATRYGQILAVCTRCHLIAK
jgi:cytochrome c553